MGLTMSEKILSAHAGRQLRAGEFALVSVDLAYVQDGTGPLTVRQLARMGFDRLHDPGRAVVFIDHASPSPRQELSNDHAFLRDFCAKTGARLSEIGSGISHQVATEDYACPGMVIVGADSHTCTNGAVGAFATGMGSTDVAAAMALGKTWMRVPETFKIVVGGALPAGVYSKDLMLHIIGLLGADGAAYKALELVGDTIRSLGLDARLTMSNMAVECGAKVGLIPTDDLTRQFIESAGRGGGFVEVVPDADAEYERVIEIDAAALKPTLAAPHFVDNTVTVDEAAGVKVHQVFIGTSTNGRLEDLRIAAGILSGRRVARGTRLIVTPASRRVYLSALAEGLVQTFVEAGGVVTGPGCGACVGVHEGVLADGEVCAATQNRNFRGRMGNPNASIYLVSPALAAATAIEGRIADPRTYLE
ncbi:MAG: 3-isopropylmalate dehydratase large subunit [bacterium]